MIRAGMDDFCGDNALEIVAGDLKWGRGVGFAEDGVDGQRRVFRNGNLDWELAGLIWRRINFPTD